MSIKINLLLIVFTMFLVGFTAVAPEGLTIVPVSNKEINRVICPERIKDVIYSQEKPVELKINDKNLFLKFLISNADGNQTYFSGDLDMYVLCGESTYHLLLKAGESISQTILLKDPISNSKKTSEIFKGMSHETKLLKLLKMAYTETYPDGFEVRDLMGKEADATVNYPGATLSIRRTAKIEGEGLFLKEYSLTPESDIETRETDFLQLAKAPLLIAIEKNVVKKNETVRLFIIEALQGAGK